MVWQNLLVWEVLFFYHEHFIEKLFLLVLLLRLVTLAEAFFPHTWVTPLLFLAGMNGLSLELHFF